MTIDYAETCACGRPLHYTNPATEASARRLVAELGPLVSVQTPEGTYLVPRHYIALHGIAAATLPQVAAELGFERVA